MKISDTIYTYPTGRNRKGLCRLRVFCNKDSQVIAVLTDTLNKNPGASITNSIELIVESLIENCIIPQHTYFIEHYEEQRMVSETFDLVIIDKEKSTEWKSISKSELMMLLNCDENEFSTEIKNNTRLLNDLEKLRTEIAPLDDLPYPVENDILKRRIEIEENKISKKNISQLIQIGANEAQFQELIKKDLSVFAELYAHPHSDYICFSEFPVANGYIDFVLISGISRMDVFLIEVKGAEFNLFNQSHYDKFSSKIETAMHQIRERLGYITRHIQEFRTEIHDIRKRVEKGEHIYNSFMGPCTHMEVDSNKDINLYSVVIGGRTIDDIKESQKRHDYESFNSLNIKVESWDTWIRKLRRE